MIWIYKVVRCTKYLSTLRAPAPLMPPNRPNGDGACVSQCPDTPAHHQNHHRPTEARVEQIDQSQSGIRSRDRNRPMRDEERTREQLSANPFCRLKGEIRLFISSCSAVTCRGNGDGWIQSLEKWREALSNDQEVKSCLQICRQKSSQITESGNEELMIEHCTYVH